MVRAIILAAGRGSRMGDQTDLQPKCLTKLSGQPLLQWQLEALHQAGLNEIAIVTGYHADSLDAYADQHFHNPRWHETNMVMSLTAASEWLAETDCIISYSDIVYHPSIVKRLLAMPQDIVITYDTQWEALWRLRFEDPLSDAETFQLDANGQLIEIGRRPESLDDIQGQYMGLLKITPIGWRQIHSLLQMLTPLEQDKLDMTSLLNRLLLASIPIQTCSIAGQWCEVDNPSDLKTYESILASSLSWEHDWCFHLK